MAKTCRRITNRCSTAELNWLKYYKLSHKYPRRRKRTIFGPMASLFVGHSPLRECSLLAPRPRPKSQAAAIHGYL